MLYYFGKAARLRRKLRRELNSARKRTEQLIALLAELPDESSRYDFLLKQKSDGLFFFDGWYWRVPTDSYQTSEDKEAGVEVKNPVKLVGILEAARTRGKLCLPAKIDLPGLTLGVMTVVGIPKPLSPGSSSMESIKYEVYKSISLWGLEVEELDIPDTVTTLENISDYPNITYFKFPDNFQRASGFGCLCNCEKLETVQFGLFPISGFTSFFYRCPSLHRFIVPEIDWLIQLTDQLGKFENYNEWSYVNPALFTKRINDISNIPIDIEIKDACEKIGHMIFPESYEKAERICDFLQAFPEYYQFILSLTMPGELLWTSDELNYDGSDVPALDVWQFDNDDRMFVFPLDRCTNLEFLVLPDTMKNIPQLAFTDNSRLREVHLPATLERIGDMAFFNLIDMKQVAFPATLQSIGEYAFAGTGLTEVDIPKGCRIEDTSFDSEVKINRIL